MVSRISASPLSRTVSALMAFLKVSISVLVGGRFRQVAERVGMLKIDCSVEQLHLYECSDLAKEHVIPADETQFLHDDPGEIPDHIAIVGHARRVEDRAVRHLAGGDVLEYDLSLLVLTELSIGHAPMPKGARIQIREALVLPGRCAA